MRERQLELTRTIRRRGRSWLHYKSQELMTGPERGILPCDRNDKVKEEEDDEEGASSESPRGEYNIQLQYSSVLLNPRVLLLLLILIVLCERVEI